MKQQLVPGTVIVVLLVMLACLVLSARPAGQEPNAASSTPRDGDALAICLALAGGTAALATAEWIRMVRRVLS